MGKLIKLLQEAHENKPKFGEPCNHCGYCCITEVCPIGQDLTGATIGPCRLLIQKDNGRFCKLAEDGTMDELLGIGTGCCAETQSEAIERLTK